MLVWKCDKCKREMSNKDDMFELYLANACIQMGLEKPFEMVNMRGKTTFDLCQECAKEILMELGGEE